MKTFKFYSQTIMVTLIMLTMSNPSKAENLNLPPQTKTETITDSYHGIEVSEAYRWLENYEDTVVQNWSDQQNDFTHEYLNELPDRPAIKRQLAELLGAVSPEYYYLQQKNDKLFAFKFQPPNEQSILITLDNADDPGSEKVILDLNVLNPDGTTSIDFYRPTHDASLVAISLSDFGSELGTVYIYKVDTGEKLTDKIPNVNGPTAGGDVAWLNDNSGFFYTRYPHQGERPDEDLSFYQQVYFHKLGTPTEEDRYVIGKEFPRIAEIELEASEDGERFLVQVSDGDGGKYAHYLLDKDGKSTQLTNFEDYIQSAKLGLKNCVYFLSRKDSPKGKILMLEPEHTSLDKAKTIIDEKENSIKYFEVTGQYLYTGYINGGPMDLVSFKHDGTSPHQISTLPVSAIHAIVPLQDEKILFSNSNYTEPSAWYQVDPADWTPRRTELYKTSPADFSDIEITREFATSVDGTKIPMNIIRKKGTLLDGTNPTILYGYGGYGICLSPYFDVGMRLWYDQGGIYVIANLRGGGEYGEDWHMAGNLTLKQNVFDDFAACAKHLIDNKYTNPDKLCIEGGSNGGLLMGAALTQHPEYFKAVVSHVGLYDMLRVELDPNGEFNITEFGTVTNPDHFKALYAYSPYHNFNAEAKYPSVMFLTGKHDGRVNPAHSRKMTALLQTTSTSDNQVYLRTNKKTGHGGGTALSEKIDKETDVYSYILDQLNIKYKHDK